ncbi:MAG: hypothetical protein HN368_11670 [Spirochaetales bacterium]|jgi:hypothetical protein|nr:hypothetical protein [Spirochaetales bacterium]
MADQFPRTTVGGVSLSRMIMGTNWILGFSHTSPAADSLIRGRNGNREAVADIVTTFLELGVDTLMGLFLGNEALLDGIKLAEDRTGKKVIRIDTPILNMDDNDKARREAESNISESAKNGATFCFPHHSSTEQLVNKNLRQIPRLPDYLSMIRAKGMIPGLSAHMPELIVYSDQNEYDVETYIQLFNCAGFLMQVEIEYIHQVIWNAKKPVMTIKPMAAGRVSPFVGLTFSFSTIRTKDMVTVGCLTPQEVAEDVEIGLAAIERRPPELEGRASPKKTMIMK